MLTWARIDSPMKMREISRAIDKKLSDNNKVDAAIYDTFVRAAKPWAYRYLLEDAQGSVGSPCAPDDHTASRYLELRASELANYLFDGLKKNAVGDEWYDNYDNSERIPSVFPSIGFWNIVNGCTGIAVSMSTSIPTFNIREVNGALIKLIKNPNVSFDEIYCPPDFPTGGTITNAKEVKESLRVGKGKSIRMRADLQYSAKDNCIIASHLPYSVYTNTVIGQLAELTAENESSTTLRRKQTSEFIFLVARIQQ